MQDEAQGKGESEGQGQGQDPEKRRGNSMYAEISRPLDAIGVFGRASSDVIGTADDMIGDSLEG
jgi:hypothetical protein